MSPAVLFDIRPTSSGMAIGVATLNRPQTLNGLSLDMCELLVEKFTEWEQDPSIAMVLLQGAGDKAFCAGGDLHGLYTGMEANTSGNAWNNPHARRFFDVEYRLDYQIHTYSKPILCWGSGIVMGGGVGLMMGASHRVVSDTTRFAMPEISIGLFPDVGGTWMLSRLPGGIGLFLALTGAQLGASDCLFLGLADSFVPVQDWGGTLDRIARQSWTGNLQQDAITLGRALKGVASATLPQGPLQRHYPLIRDTCDGRDFDAICAGIAEWAHHDDPWLARAAKTFLAGAPGSARLSFTLLQRVRLMSLADVFREEYVVSLQCGVQGDFREGIRALLIDKDKQPRWKPANLDEATDAWVQRFFQRPWPAGMPHPLEDLGESHHAAVATTA